MSRKIHLTSPRDFSPRIARSNWERPLPTTPALEVNLFETKDVLEMILDEIDKARRENLEVEGIVLGAISYLSIEEYVKSSGENCMAATGARVSGKRAELTIWGIRIHMDPNRDAGIALIYSSQSALDIYSRRLAAER